MLRGVDISNARGDTMSLSLVNAQAEAVQVRNITGLDPVKAVITTAPFGAYDGESFSGAGIGKRNIVLTLGLNTSWSTQTTAELRYLIYRYLMPKMPVTMLFTTDEIPGAKISGYVEAVETNIFAKAPEMQVSVICPLPDFVATDATVLTGVTGATGPAYYDGSVPAGFVAQIKSAAARPSYTGDIALRVASSGYGSTQDFIAAAFTVDTNNYLEMCSLRGKKYLRSIAASNGAPTNLLRKLGGGSVWPELLPGDNQISFPGTPSGLAWALTYNERYGGL